MDEKDDSVNDSNQAKEEVFTEYKNPESLEPKKKKATFELDDNLHRELKMFSAREGKKMVEVVEEAVRMYLQQKG